MTDLLLQKMPGGYLLPVTQQDAEIVTGWKVGQGIRCTFTKARNLDFHRKFFAMLNFGFENWEQPEVEHAGDVARKSFERFRKDIVIAAGYYTLTVNLKGEARAEAQSISFGSMDEPTFQKLYDDVAEVLVRMVLRNHTRADLDHVVNELLRFAA